jgi:hypothetical protein
MLSSGTTIKMHFGANSTDFQHKTNCSSMLQSDLSFRSPRNKVASLFFKLSFEKYKCLRLLVLFHLSIVFLCFAVVIAVYEEQNGKN